MQKHLCQHRHTGVPHLERIARRDVQEADDTVAPTFIAIGTLPALDVAMGWHNPMGPMLPSCLIQRELFVVQFIAHSAFTWDPLATDINNLSMF